MDELSLLEAVSSDEALAAEEAIAPETALSSVQQPDFTGSLDYIDSLASRSAIAISQRDIRNIATAAYLSSSSDVDSQKAVLGRPKDALQSLTDFRPLGDARRFDFQAEGSTAPLGLVRSSARVVSPPSIRQEFPRKFRNPLDPSRDVGDLNRTFASIERRLSRKPFAFQKPNQVVICLKRKIRRQVMASMNFPMRPWPIFRRRTNAFSRVIC